MLRKKRHGWRNMEPTVEQRAKMKTISDVCEWVGLSNKKPIDEEATVLVSPREAFLLQLGLEEDAHWRILANVPIEKLNKLIEDLKINKAPPTVAQASQIGLVKH